MKTETLFKMSGSGNSFIFWDEDRVSKESIQKKERSQWVRSFFERSPIQADGFVFLKQTGPQEITWDFYNKDGSFAEMCGNAARCVGWYGFEQDSNNRRFELKTLSGSVFLEKQGDSKIQVLFSFLNPQLKDVEIPWQDQILKGVFLDTGVPHFVLQGKSDKDIALFCRQYEKFNPQGANISFYQEITDGVIESVSFERGVEDFTLACGTGAIATALVYKRQTACRKPIISVRQPGGVVEVSLIENQIGLIGPTSYEGEVDWL